MIAQEGLDGEISVPLWRPSERARRRDSAVVSCIIVWSLRANVRGVGDVLIGEVDITVDVKVPLGILALLLSR